MYHLSGNVISATVGFVYINLQPEYELPSRLVSDNSGRKFAKIGVGAPSSLATTKEIVSARAPSFCLWLNARQM